MNLFFLPKKPQQEELINLLCTGNGLRMERIVSCGQISPSGFWYDQEEDEWVAVLQGIGELELKTGETVRLEAGDCYLLPAHCCHRVSFTSSAPPCIWLCVFGQNFHME